MRDFRETRLTQWLTEPQRQVLQRSCSPRQSPGSGGTRQPVATTGRHMRDFQETRTLLSSVGRHSWAYWQGRTDAWLSGNPFGSRLAVGKPVTPAASPRHCPPQPSGSPNPNARRTPHASTGRQVLHLGFPQVEHCLGNLRTAVAPQVGKPCTPVACAFVYPSLARWLCPGAGSATRCSGLGETMTKPDNIPHAPFGLKFKIRLEKFCAGKPGRANFSQNAKFKKRDSSF
jgi:hypothetical protein